jgi:hypothetical protein
MQIRQVGVKCMCLFYDIHTVSITCAFSLSRLPGFIPHAFNWLVIICYFFVGVSRGSPPGFVWAIIFILFILDITFAVNQYYQQQVCNIALFSFSLAAVFPFVFAYFICWPFPLLHTNADGFCVFPSPSSFGSVTAAELSPLNRRRASGPTTCTVSTCSACCRSSPSSCWRGSTLAAPRPSKRCQPSIQKSRVFYLHSE